MDQEKLLEAVNALFDGLRADMAKQIDGISAKYDALAGSVAKMKADGEREENNHLGRRVAADAVDPSAFAALSASVADLRKKQSRPMGDLNAFADAQSKADAVMRVHGDRAEPPMVGEDLIAYNIRLAKKLQPHSKVWKGVDLALIAADQQAFNIALDGIRSDAMQAGLNPVHLPKYEFRPISETTPGGHVITKFVGNGTIFGAMNHPRRFVTYIGPRNFGGSPS